MLPLPRTLALGARVATGLRRSRCEIPLARSGTEHSGTGLAGQAPRSFSSTDHLRRDPHRTIERRRRGVSSHASTRLGSAGLQRYVCRARVCVSITAASCVRATTLSPCNSHTKPAWSILAYGRSRSQPNKSIGSQPSAAAFSPHPPSKNRPMSRMKVCHHFTGTSPGGRLRSSRESPSTQARGTLPRLAKTARDSRVSPETAAGDVGARRRSSSSKVLKDGGMSIFDGGPLGKPRKSRLSSKVLIGSTG